MAIDVRSDTPLRSRDSDRPRSQGAPAVAGAWLAFMGGVVAGGGVKTPAAVALAGALGLSLVLVGFAAVARARPSPRNSTRRERLALLSLVVGIVLGVANLAANWAIAQANPMLRALLVERMARLAPLDALVASPLLEEVGVRLFLMSLIAWVVVRFTKNVERAFAIALVGSALVFALMHLARPLPADMTLVNYYRAALGLKYTLAGLPLGWIFWRWGLPYAIICHAAANAAHLVLQGRVF